MMHLSKGKNRVPGTRLGFFYAHNFIEINFFVSIIIDDLGQWRYMTNQKPFEFVI